MIDIEGVFVIKYTGCRERWPGIDREVERVFPGIRKYDIINYPTPYDALVMRNVRLNWLLKTEKGQNFFSATMGHYRALKTAYELGMEIAAIVEDDARFMLSKEEIFFAMGDLPRTWDILLMDHFRPGSMGAEEYSKQMENVGSYHWRRTGNSRSGAAYVVSRSGMERLIRLYEEPVTCGKVLRVCDQYFNKKRIGMEPVMLAACPNLAIQGESPSSNSGYTHIHEHYSAMGLRREEYAASAAEEEEQT